MNKKVIKWFLCCISVCISIPILVVVAGLIEFLITTYWKIILCIILSIFMGTYIYLEWFDSDE